MKKRFRLEYTAKNRNDYIGYYRYACDIINVLKENDCCNFIISEYRPLINEYRTIIHVDHYILIRFKRYMNVPKILVKFIADNFFSGCERQEFIEYCKKYNLL